MKKERTPMPMDDEARAELLTFLVVAQLFARARSGTWLQAGHLIESAQLWTSSNGARCDWLDRAKLVAASRDLAEPASKWDSFGDEAALVRLFDLQAGWILDYRTDAVRRLHALCVRHLAQRYR